MAGQYLLHRGDHPQTGSKDGHDHELLLDSNGRSAFHDGRIHRGRGDGHLAECFVGHESRDLAGQAEKVRVRGGGVTQLTDLVRHNGVVDDKR